MHHCACIDISAHRHRHQGHEPVHKHQSLAGPARTKAAQCWAGAHISRRRPPGGRSASGPCGCGACPQQYPLRSSEQRGPDPERFARITRRTLPPCRCPPPAPGRTWPANTAGRRCENAAQRERSSASGRAHQQLRRELLQDHLPQNAKHRFRSERKVPISAGKKWRENSCCAKIFR